MISVTILDDPDYQTLMGCGSKGRDAMWVFCAIVVAAKVQRNGGVFKCKLDSVGRAVRFSQRAIVSAANLIREITVAAEHEPWIEPLKPLDSTPVADRLDSDSWSARDFLGGLAIRNYRRYNDHPSSSTVPSDPDPDTVFEPEKKEGNKTPSFPHFPESGEKVCQETGSARNAQYQQGVTPETKFTRLTEPLPPGGSLISQPPSGERAGGSTRAAVQGETTEVPSPAGADLEAVSEKNPQPSANAGETLSSVAGAVAGGRGGDVPGLPPPGDRRVFAFAEHYFREVCPGGQQAWTTEAFDCAYRQGRVTLEQLECHIGKLKHDGFPARDWLDQVFPKPRPWERGPATPAEKASDAAKEKKDLAYRQADELAGKYQSWHPQHLRTASTHHTARNAFVRAIRAGVPVAALRECVAGIDAEHTETASRWLAREFPPPAKLRRVK